MHPERFHHRALTMTRCHAWTPKMTVTQFKAEKPSSAQVNDELHAGRKIPEQKMLDIMFRQMCAV